TLLQPTGQPVASRHGRGHRLDGPDRDPRPVATTPPGERNCHRRARRSLRAPEPTRHRYRPTSQVRTRWTHHLATVDAWVPSKPPLERQSRQERYGSRIHCPERSAVPVVVGSFRDARSERTFLDLLDPPGLCRRAADHVGRDLRAERITGHLRPRPRAATPPREQP